MAAGPFGLIELHLVRKHRIEERDYISADLISARRSFFRMSAEVYVGEFAAMDGCLVLVVDDRDGSEASPRRLDRRHHRSVGMNAHTFRRISFGKFSAKLAEIQTHSAATFSGSASTTMSRMMVFNSKSFGV